METMTGHWDSRDNRDTLIVLCPEMSQRDPSFMAWDNLGQMSQNVPDLSLSQGSAVSARLRRSARGMKKVSACPMPEPRPW
jgi:hypothetical protein